MPPVDESSFTDADRRRLDELVRRQQARQRHLAEDPTSTGTNGNCKTPTASTTSFSMQGLDLQAPVTGAALPKPLPPNNDSSVTTSIAPAADTFSGTVNIAWDERSPLREAQPSPQPLLRGDRSSDTTAVGSDDAGVGCSGSGSDSLVGNNTGKQKHTSTLLIEVPVDDAAAGVMELPSPPRPMTPGSQQEKIGLLYRHLQAAMGELKKHKANTVEAREEAARHREHAMTLQVGGRCRATWHRDWLVVRPACVCRDLR
jgi:hypothetical protein